MKKTTLLFTTILMLLIFNVSAQKVGFQMGANFSKIHFKEIPEAYQHEKMLIAPKLGFLFDIPLNENFFISTGLFTHLRGMSYESKRDIGDIYNDDYETYDTEEYLLIWVSKM